MSALVSGDNTATENAGIMLRGDEGYRAMVYDDATGIPLRTGHTLVGNPTIGYGTDLTFPIRLETAEQMLDERITRIYTVLSEESWYKNAGSYLRHAVLIDIAYNVGVDGIRKFVRMIAALDARNYADAAKEIRDSAACRAAPDRYRRLAAIMRDNVYPDPTE
jgi:lysozyme